MKTALAAMLDTALQGTTAEAYLLKAPRNAQAPYVVYRDIAGTVDEDVSLCSAMQETLVQFSIYSEKYNQACLNICTAVRSIEGVHAGTIGFIQFSNEREFYESKPKLFGKTIDLDVHFYK